MDTENGGQFSRATWLVIKARFNMLARYHVAIIIKPNVITAEWIFHHEEIRYHFALLDIFLFDPQLFVSYL